MPVRRLVTVPGQPPSAAARCWPTTSTSATAAGASNGLGPPPDVTALKDQIQGLQQENLDLRRRAEEREEELSAAREANRRLMTELNHHR
jgi:hypothetical protein